MSPGYVVYNTLAHLAAPLVLAAVALKGRLRGRWTERLGLIRPRPFGDGPRVWVHAVSVGEVQAALALIGALRERAPNLNIWLTTTTAAGRSAARDALGPDFPLFTFPLDILGGPARSLARLCPDLVVVLETELWPNFLRLAGRSRAKVMMANGRLSPRSMKRYRLVRFFFREVIGFLDLMAMIREDDRDRILSLGAPPEKVLVAGNAKYDLLMSRVDEGRRDRLARETGLGSGFPVLAAGSTRSGEEAVILDAFRRLRRDFPDLRLILAPRHTNRAAEVAGLVRDRGLTLALRSAGPRPGPDPPDVTLVDVMGELFYLYGLADVAFCGASLVRLGGQNPLEPAAWGVPVLYGSNMDDFLDAKAMLEEHGAGRVVKDGAELYQAVRDLLTAPEQARRKGRAGRDALARHRGAAGRLADMALDLLAEKEKAGDA